VTAPVLDSIRDCFEGIVPAVLATCDAAGVPNVSIISQVHYVDPDHVALTYQFFNKTRQNLLATRAAAVSVFNPVDLTDYRLDLDFEETQTAGPIFESMKAKLAGIASHTGMHGVFLLQGADICRVRSIAAMPGAPAQRLAPRNLLSAVRHSFGELAAASDLGELCDRTLDSLRRFFGVEHAMVLMLDDVAGRLFTVASTGYAISGVGSELGVGEGVVGVAAREGVPIRIGHMTSEYSYSTTIREQALHHGLAGGLAAEIPYPGLSAPESQIAVPIVSAGRTLGVLFAESTEPMRFRHDDEDGLALVAVRLGDLMLAIPQDDASVPRKQASPAPMQSPDRQIVVRHYEADDSVFLDHDYLIKGVAGAIFWTLVREHARTGRVEFSNRELRLDPSLRLPEYAENLEARLVLLQRRLCERSAIRIEKCGRGRFRLVVPCRLALDHIASGR
jgi:adenylate cyclase